MKRIIILIFASLLVFAGQTNAQSFPSKQEEMDYSKRYHNGAILSLQQYLNSHSEDELITAIKDTFAATEIVTKYVVDLSDVTSYGSDAVRIVKTSNYLMAFYLHEIFHKNISDSNNQIAPNAILNHYYANLLWMNQMTELNNKVEWLWGAITEQDMNAIIALIQTAQKDSTWKINDRLAGDKSLLQKITNNYFDTSCFKINGKWILFYDLN